MNPRLKFIPVLLCLAILGCAMMPQQRVYSARRAYTTLLETLNVAQRDGLIDQAAHDHIEPYRAAAAQALDAWDAAIAAGDDASRQEASDAFERAIHQLRTVYLAIKSPATQAGG